MLALFCILVSCRATTYFLACNVFLRTNRRTIANDVGLSGTGFHCDHWSCGAS